MSNHLSKTVKKIIFDFAGFVRDIGRAKDISRKVSVPCPWHEEKSPSCVIDIDTMKYHCFGCGKEGDWKWQDTHNHANSLNSRA